MDERTERLLERLETWCEAYPISIFPSPEGSYLEKCGDYDTKEKRALITRSSAAMGRHMIEKALKPAIEEIKRLASDEVEA